jgi:pimeloyl-ACP methyl ester carboxylesterase
MPTLLQPGTYTLDVPGAALTYDVRAGEPGSGPALVLIGSPMGAGGFATLAGHFPERTVVTYDPRGVERSSKDDPTSPSTPEEHADDLHRVLSELGGDEVDLFASSGGAVNALALVARHPEQVRTLVAHEPPVASIVGDREGALAATRAVHEAYEQHGFGAGMAQFIALLTHRGLIDDEFLGRPPADPAMFGMPTEDDGVRTDAMLGQNIVSCTHYEPDFDALRRAQTRIVVAAGAASDGELAHRGAEAVAARLGLPVVIFPGDHGGFLGGEYGQTGEPDAFAVTLREVLEGA